MITPTLAAMALWGLEVKMYNFYGHIEGIEFNKTIGKISTPQECETLAINEWRKFISANNQSKYMLITSCSAYQHEKYYKWDINCDTSMHCNTIKYEGYYKPY